MTVLPEGRRVSFAILALGVMTAMYPRLDAQTTAALAERLRPGASPTGEYPLSAPPAVPTALV
jgi:hypothetical protein